MDITQAKHSYHYTALLLLAIIMIIAVGSLCHLAVKNNTIVMFSNGTERRF